MLGWAVGGVVFYREFRRRGWPLETMLFVMFGCAVGATVGSLVCSVLFFDWPEVWRRIEAREFVGRTVLGGIAAELVLWSVQEADCYRVGGHNLQHPGQVGPLDGF